MKHSFLNKYIKQPFIDEGKLLILSGIMEGTDFSKNTKEQFIITAMLVQIALDTHDHVPAEIDGQESKTAKLEKQLRVLAGDYYSGLYYMLLSELEEIDLIHKLATAIKEINEYKMKVYYHEADSLMDHMDFVMRTESLVALSLAHYVENVTFIPLILDWMYVNKLIFIKTKGKSIINQWQIYYPEWTYSSIEEKIDEIIKHKSHKINRYLQTLPDWHSLHGIQVEGLLKKVWHGKSMFAEGG
ncbi:heptaprenyl diphosphate synthase component 1 [Virgibacillus sp. SK37]|uniref:heptaprenyl diphosphate synthase component 1 n=1 Tax=Virgibacillus sp. SK37 TaxID=403957 RepID=UPI0006939D05|nr:heptaprenyl diphosphate synthase component 1 [Virgibacillus sp. SK37]